MHASDRDIALNDLAEDIGEHNDVAAAHPRIVRRIREIMGNAGTPWHEFPLPLFD